MIRRSTAPGLAVLLLVSGALAQVTFKKAWSWYGNSKGNTVLQADDGGYVIGAQAHPTRQIGSALIRTDSLGDTLWVRFLEYKGGGGGEACQTSDHNFVVISDTIDAPSGRCMVTATKVGKHGEVIWSRFYPPGHDLHRSVWPTSDGGVVVCGKLTGGSGRGAGLMKLDIAGNLTWKKVLRHPDDTTFTSGYSVEQTRDGGFIVAGRLDGEGETYAFLAKTDSSGDTVWTRTIAGELPSSSVRQTADGGYIVTGVLHDTVAVGLRAYLMKTDSSGEVQWFRRYGWGSDRYYGKCVRQMVDGGYVAAGLKRPSGVSWAIAWLMRTDSSGDTLWTREYPYPPWSSTIFYWVEQTADGGFVMTGEVNYHNVYLVKTDSLGRVHGGGVEEQGSHRNGEVLRLSICRGVLRLPGKRPADLLDIAGRRVMALQPGMNDIRSVSPGVYFLRSADSGERSAVRKIVIQR